MKDLKPKLHDDFNSFSKPKYQFIGYFHHYITHMINNYLINIVSKVMHHTICVCYIKNNAPVNYHTLNLWKHICVHRLIVYCQFQEKHQVAEKLQKY